MLLAATVLYTVVGFSGSLDYQSLELWAFAIFGGWFGIRCLRVGVVVTPNGIRAQNFFRTRAAERSQISVINLQERNEGESGYHWFPQVQLIDGSSFWISSLDCGPTRNNPWPDRLEQVHELRRILRVDGTDAGESQPRPNLLNLARARRNGRGR